MYSPASSGTRTLGHLALSGVLSAAFLLFPAPRAGACTGAVVVGNASKDGRPIWWKTRDMINVPHTCLSFKQGGVYGYLSMSTYPGGGAAMGLNEAGFPMGNMAGDFRDMARFDNVAIHEYVLGHLASVDEMRANIERNLTDGFPDWISPNSALPVIDRHGKAAFFEVGAIDRVPVVFEYDPLNPARLEQYPDPQTLIVRANATHRNTDHRDDPDTGGERYYQTRDRMMERARSGGIDIAFMMNDVVRFGEPRWQRKGGWVHFNRHQERLDAMRREGVLSFSAWFKYEGDGEIGPIIALHRGPRERIYLHWRKTRDEGSISIFGQIGRGERTIAARADGFEPHGWHHVVWVIDGTTHNLYLNGEQVIENEEARESICALPDRTRLYFGTENRATRGFSGVLDEIRMYGRALSADEIATLFARQPFERESEDLVGHWRFEEGEGTVARDASGRGMHGAIEGEAFGWSEGIDGKGLRAEWDAPAVEPYPSRRHTVSVMLVHGVKDGEDPRISTAWVTTDNPDYTPFTPAWVAIGPHLSKRITGTDPLESLTGRGRALFSRGIMDGYDAHINRLLAPMEENFLHAVSLARARWFEHGFCADEALRIHLESCETAWHTLNALCRGEGWNLNVTPVLAEIQAETDGLAVKFSAAAGDPDGFIARYSWDFGDGGTSSEAAPEHRYASPGSYLVHCTVEDDGGSRNTRWLYVDLKWRSATGGSMSRNSSTK